MAATIHVIARFTAKAGKEDALKTALSALVAPSRREIGCYQYDLLVNPSDPRDFCLVERWDTDRALEQHRETPHVKTASAQSADLVEGAPDIRVYALW